MPAPGDHKSVVRVFDNMHALGLMESSSASNAVVASAALSSAATSDASKFQWLQYTYGCCSHCIQFFGFYCSCWNRLFGISYDAGCRLSSSSVCHVLDACSRLRLSLEEIESVYTRHLSVGAVDEKFFIVYLRSRLTLSTIKVVGLLQDVISDMSQLSNPILPFVKLFNVTLSLCTSAHEAAQVRIVYGSS